MSVDYLLQPDHPAEHTVFQYMKDTMGEGRESAALEEWAGLSREFTIEENTANYDREDFHKARAKYVTFRFEEELKIWPMH